MARRRYMNDFKMQVMSEVLNKKISNADEVKMEVAKQFNIPLKERGNGNIKAKDAGKIGGMIGGHMVKEMIRLAQSSLANQRS